MGPIEEALRDKFFPALFRGEEINAYFGKILGNSVKRLSYNGPPVVIVECIQHLQGSQWRSGRLSLRRFHPQLRRTKVICTQGKCGSE